MPWKEQRVMSEKLQFIEKAAAPGANISALCQEYGVSRQTGYKWLRRFRADGYPGLVEQSRRPDSSPLTTGEELVVRLLELRERHSTWGADKISRVLRREIGDEAPSKSTVARILGRLGRLKRRRPRVRVWSVDGKPRVEVHGPNDLWTVDFKGWWKARNGDRCEPLTVRDAFSRKVLGATLVESTRGDVAREEFERLFRKHGLPMAVQSDNGTPFVCTRGRGGLSRLSVWLLSLGIRVVRSRPGCPQDNGGHERMHRDLAELQISPAHSRRAQQRECDRWMVDFNEIRPHDALGGKTPAEVYRDSERRSLVPLEPSYPSGWTTRRVSKCGTISIDDDVVHVSTALAGQTIGLKKEGLLRWRARYFELDLGILEIVPFVEDLAVNRMAGREAAWRPAAASRIVTALSAPCNP
jgi:transposase InsO family protein